MVKATGERTIMDLSIDEIKNLSPEEKKCVTTHGTIHNVRDMGDFAFVIIRKIGGLMQCVYNMKGIEEKENFSTMKTALRLQAK